MELIQLNQLTEQKAWRDSLYEVRVQILWAGQPLPVIVARPLLLPYQPKLSMYAKEYQDFIERQAESRLYLGTIWLKVRDKFVIPTVQPEINCVNLITFFCEGDFFAFLVLQSVNILWCTMSLLFYIFFIQKGNIISKTKGKGGSF